MPRATNGFQSGLSRSSRKCANEVSSDTGHRTLTRLSNSVRAARSRQSMLTVLLDLSCEGGSGGNCNRVEEHRYKADLEFLLAPRHFFLVRCVHLNQELQFGRNAARERASGFYHDLAIVFHESMMRCHES